MDKLSVAVVFDRKKELTKGKKQGKVEIRITINRIVKYWVCSFKIESKQWDAKNQRVRNSVHSEVYNDEISIRLDKVFAFYNQCTRDNVAWNFDAFKKYTEGKKDESFIAFAKRRIEERTDLTASSKKMQRSQIAILEEYGKIQFMSDLTYANIMYYNEWLQKRYDSQSTVWTKLKTIKHYCREAMLFDLIDKNPFDKFKMEKGDSEGAPILLYEDFLKIMELKLPKALVKVRDIMAVQFYTGLSYSDLSNADFTNLTKVGEYEMLVGNRQKTHQSYYIPILDECKAILEKYEYKLPMMTSQQLNIRYRTIAENVIDYHISSHSLRKGCGSYLISKGVPLEIISKILGHSNTKITEKIYAKLSLEAIAETTIRTIERKIEKKKARKETP